MGLMSCRWLSHLSSRHLRTRLSPLAFSVSLNGRTRSTTRMFSAPRWSPEKKSLMSTWVLSSPCRPVLPARLCFRFGPRHLQLLPNSLPPVSQSTLVRSTLHRAPNRTHTLPVCKTTATPETSSVQLCLEPPFLGISNIHRRPFALSRFCPANPRGQGRELKNPSQDVDGVDGPRRSATL